MDFTENLFTVPKIDIDEIEKAAYDRGYAEGQRVASKYGDKRYSDGYEAGYFAGLENGKEIYG